MPVAAGGEAQNDKTTLSKTFFDDYAAALGSLDPQRILPYYHEPLTLITAPITSILTTRAEIEQWPRLSERLVLQTISRTRTTRGRSRTNPTGFAASHGCRDEARRGRRSGELNDDAGISARARAS